MGRREEDIDFMSEVNAAARRSASRFAFILSFTAFAFFVLFFVWAEMAVLDEVTRGEGQVIPSRRVQTIQNLEGGIVSEMMVSEGSIVEPNQILLRIDNTMAKSTYQEEKTRYNILRARVARLEAEISGGQPDYPDDLLKEAPETIESEKRQFRISQEQQNAEVSVLQSRVTQRRQEVDEMRSRQSQLQSSLGALQEEYRMTEPLVAQGIVPQLDLVRLKRQLADIEGEIRTIKVSIPRAQNAVREAEQQIRELSANRKADASRSLLEARAELETLTQAMQAGADRFKRTEVKSPVKGTIKQIFVNTVGGVIQPGEPIMEIVPLDDTLLIEAKIKPSDIAFIRPDQEAVVKITAYDFSIYGGLKGKVERISADTVTDDKGNSFYKIQLRTKETSLHHRGKELPIIPGMTASIDILTGQKSVLDYLLKPILKARDTAMRER